jgi:hypothetical protein
MTTANNVKLIKMLSDRYKFDADDAIEYVKTASKKGRPKKQIEVEQAKDLFDKILEDAGEPPLEKDPALYKKFEKAPEKVNKTAEKEAKKLEKDKKAAEKAAEKEKKAAEKEAKKLEKEKKAAEKEAKKLEKEKKASDKTSKKEVKQVVVAPVKTVTQVDSSDDESSDDEDEEHDDDVVELKPEEKELVVIRHTPIEELVIDESSDDEVDEDVNKIVQSVIKAKMAKYEAIKDAGHSDKEESDDEDEEEDYEEEEEEVVKVKRVKINDKDYLKSINNVLYDVDTNDAIGVWDENKQEIILNELDEDSYVEEDNNEESEDEESDDEDE